MQSSALQGLRALTSRTQSCSVSVLGLKCSSISAYAAFASPTPDYKIASRKLMADEAHIPSSSHGRWTIAPENVYSLSYVLHVIWIYAARRTTEMVEYVIRRAVARYPGMTMREACFTAGTDSKHAISLVVQGPNPQPTPTHRLRLHLVPEPHRQSFVKEMHSLNVSHIPRMAITNSRMP